MGWSPVKRTCLCPHPFHGFHDYCPRRWKMNPFRFIALSCPVIVEILWTGAIKARCYLIKIIPRPQINAPAQSLDWTRISYHRSGVITINLTGTHHHQVPQSLVSRSNNIPADIVVFDAIKKRTRISSTHKRRSRRLEIPSNEPSEGYKSND